MSNQKLTREEQEKLNQNLLNAVWKNNLPAVKEAVEAGALVNSEDKYGKSALQKSIFIDIGIMEYLLQAGADPNIQDNNNSTPLILSAYQGYLDKVQLLLSYGADMYMKDNSGCTSFDSSLIYNHYDIAEFLISHGYVPSKEGMQKVKNNRLFNAIKQDDLHAVKTAIADGADVNTRDAYGYFPLYISTCSICFNIAITEYLLNAGADPNVLDYYSGFSALHEAARYGQLEHIRLLLKYNANMYIRSEVDDYTPFAYALLFEHYDTDTADFFIVSGYMPSEEDFKGIKGKAEREKIKVHCMTMAAQVQEHKARLTEETESQEFSYADEVIEM